MDHDKKPLWYWLPALLTGLAALIAALTGVYVNLRQEHSSDSVGHKTVAKTRTPAASATAPKLGAMQSTTMRLRVERIAVQHDGSIGTTDWRFAVEANGQPLFVLQQDGLDDTGGRNVATPSQVSAVLHPLSRQLNRIVVNGWRGSRLRLSPGQPDATGEGVLTQARTITPIVVTADQENAGAFVFYFSVVPE